MRILWRPWCVAALLFIPPSLAVFFILAHAHATPLTDEWILVYNAMAMQAAPATLPGILGALGEMRWSIYAHLIVLPNLIYLVIGPLVKFDSRVFSFLTLACNGLILLCVYARGLRGLPLAVASILIFSPARYTEMLWGFQFVLGMSVALGVAGLTLIDAGNGYPRKKMMLAAGVGAIMAGALCSAPAIFAAAAAALMAKSFEGTGRGLAALPAAIAVCLVILRHAFGNDFLDPGLNMLLFIPTAIGSLLFSMDGYFTTFDLSIRAVAGLAILIADGAIIFNAWRNGMLERHSYAISLIIYGLLTVAMVGMTRSYFANWHLHCALPILLGSLFLMARSLPLGSLLIAVAALFGYWHGVSQGGEHYDRYAEKIVSYMRGLPGDPLLPKPYPPTAEWDARPALVEFLAAAGHPDFVDLNIRK